MPDSDSDTSDRSVYDEQLSSLESLPQEVLVSIWSRLDSPSSLSMTSYYLYSKSCLSAILRRTSRIHSQLVPHSSLQHANDKALKAHFILLIHALCSTSSLST